MKESMFTSPLVMRIPLSQIRPSPRRHYFGQFHLEILQERMRAYGLVDPIVVRRVQGSYEIVDGMRRWWAARLLGWRSIDAKILAV